MPTLRLLLLAALALLLPACTSEFQKAWQAPTPPVAPSPTSNLLGKWHGTWLSDGARGHGDALVIISTLPPAAPPASQPAPANSNPNEATYLLTINQRVYTDDIFSLPITASLPISKSDTPGKIEYRGTLTRNSYWYGQYHYFGYAVGDTLYIRYTSETDRGTFTLTRVP